MLVSPRRALRHDEIVGSAPCVAGCGTVSSCLTPPLCHRCPDTGAGWLGAEDPGEVSDA